MKIASHVGSHSIGDILMLQQPQECSVRVCVCVCVCVCEFLFLLGYRKWDEKCHLGLCPPGNVHPNLPGMVFVLWWFLN